MLKIDTERKELALLQIDEIGSLTQRFELRELIGNSPDAFFGEIGQDVFVIAKDLRLILPPCRAHLASPALTAPGLRELLHSGFDLFSRVQTKGTAGRRHAGPKRAGRIIKFGDTSRAEVPIARREAG